MSDFKQFKIVKDGIENTYLVKDQYARNSLATKQDKLTFDTTPTQNSTNPVTSGGVYTSLDGKQNTLTFDNTPTEGSSNPVYSGGVYSALEEKQDTLTFDNTPIQDSQDPVTSDGIYKSILKLYPVDTEQGNVVSFVSEFNNLPLESVVANFSPTQDLHGYSNPWPAGGGVNKWDEEWEVGSIDTTTGENVTVNYGIRSKNFIPVIEGNTYYMVCPTGRQIIFYNSQKEFHSYDQQLDYVNLITIPNGVSYIRFCTYAVYGRTYKNDISLNYPSTVTTYSPYSNICPISGASNITTYITGKNLFGTGTLYQENTLYYADGTAHESTSFDTYRFKCTANKPITFSGVPQSTSFIIRALLFNKQMEFIELLANNVSGSVDVRTSATATPTSDGWVVVSVRKTAVNLQFEFSSTFTTYEEYKGSSYSVSLNGTRYGSSLYVTKGRLEYKRVIRSGFSRGSLDSSGKLYQIAKVNGQYGDEQSTYISDVYCSIFPVVSLTEARESQVPCLTYFGTTAFSEYIYVGGYVGKEDELDAILASGDLVVIYPLRIAYTSTTQQKQINTLEGINNIWHDANGTIEVQYKENIQTYIDKKVSQIRDLVTQNN